MSGNIDLNITKERPADFQEMIGSEKTLTMIQNHLKSGHFPQVSIFSGEEGLGKSTAAKLAAKTFSCENPTFGLACNGCPTCLKVDEEIIYGNKTECAFIRIFDMSDESGKQSARDIVEYIRMRVPPGKTKVLMLEEAQGSTYAAQDVLLRHFEYIPDNVKIILMTTEIESLQKTLVSRASTFHFTTPDRRQLIFLLQKIATRNKIEIDNVSVYHTICEYAENKPRAAINTLKLLTGLGNKLDIISVNEALNIVNETLYLEYLGILRSDMGATLDFIDKLREKEVRYLDFIKGLNNFMLKLLTFKYRKADFTPDLVDLVRNFLGGFAEKDLLRIQYIIADESSKINHERMAKHQMVGLTFRLMNRNNEEMLEDTVKTEESVQKENNQHLENLVKETSKKIKDNSSANLQADPNQILSKLGNSFRINLNPNQVDE